MLLELFLEADAANQSTFAKIANLGLILTSNLLIYLSDFGQARLPGVQQHACRRGARHELDGRQPARLHEALQPWRGRKRSLFFPSTFSPKMIILPRQAWDKHREENSQTRDRFLAGDL